MKGTGVSLYTIWEGWLEHFHVCVEGFNVMGTEVLGISQL